MATLLNKTEGNYKDAQSEISLINTVNINTFSVFRAFLIDNNCSCEFSAVLKFPEVKPAENEGDIINDQSFKTLAFSDLKCYHRGFLLEVGTIRTPFIPLNHPLPICSVYNF